VEDNEFLRLAVMIYVTVVNTQTDSVLLYESKMYRAIMFNDRA